MAAKSEYNPFYRSVPRPIGILILIFMFIPPTFSGGAYLSNINEMVGGLAVSAEDIQLASFFTNIGMCLFPPLMIRFLQTRSVRNTYLFGFIALFFLIWICAETDSMPILLMSCLVIGVVRVIVMLNCTFTIAPYLTGVNTLEMFTNMNTLTADEQYAQERKRTFLMPVLYTFILIIAQFSNIVTSWFAYNYTWQDSYYMVMGMLVVAILLVITTMPQKLQTVKTSIDKSLLTDMILLACCLCNLIYILVFGKQLDWFDNQSINVALSVFLFSSGIFIYQSVRKRRIYYLPPGVFKYRNIWISILLFLMFMIFNSATVFITTFAKLSTPINNFQNALLNNWAIIGCLIGFAISIIMVFFKIRFKIIFAIALTFMLLSNLFMYFDYRTVGDYQRLAIPMFFNFTGLIMLYSLVPAFSMKSLPSRYLVTAVFIMILVRNAIAPAVGSSVYTNWLNERQQYYITQIADDLNIQNQMSSATYKAASYSELHKGKSEIESQQYATTLIKSKTTIQATLLAMKDITGKTIWMIIGVILLVLIIPYNKNETT